MGSLDIKKVDKTIYGRIYRPGDGSGQPSDYSTFQGWSQESHESCSCKTSQCPTEMVGFSIKFLTLLSPSFCATQLVQR